MQQKPQKKPLMIVSFQLDQRAELEIKIFSERTFRKEIFEFIQNQKGINKKVKQKIFQRALKFATSHIKTSQNNSVKSFKSITKNKESTAKKPIMKRIKTCNALQFNRRLSEGAQKFHFNKKAQPRSSLLNLRNKQQQIQHKTNFQTLKCNTIRRANTDQDRNFLRNKNNYSSFNNLHEIKPILQIDDLSSVLTSSDQNGDDSQSKQTLKNDFLKSNQSVLKTQQIVEQRTIKTSKSKVFKKLKPIKVKPIRQSKKNCKLQNDITFRNTANKPNNIMLKNHDIQLQTKLIHLQKQHPQLFEELEFLFVKLDNKNLTYINQQNLDLRNLNQRELKIVESIFLDIFSLKQNDKMYIENFMDAFIQKNNIQL